MCSKINEQQLISKYSRGYRLEERQVEQYNGKALGVFEVDNLVAAFVALDAASKAADVSIQGVERNRLKSGACVKMRGDISSVNAAMDVAVATASRLGKVTASTIIASPSEGTEVATVMTINK